MRKKLLIVALVAGLLPTLFSCNCSEETTESGEKRNSLKVMEEYELSSSYDMNSGISISTVITNTDTIVIWSKSRCGSVILERKPVNK